MNEIKIFEHEQFGKVRSTIVEGEPWFVGKDVAEKLGYRDTSDALKRHVDEEDKLTRRFTDSGQNREMYIVNESGLYSLVLSSKLPTAKAFKRWITSEVIPSIRKYGAYATPVTIEKILQDPDFGVRLLSTLKDEREQRKRLEVEVATKEQEIVVLKPKAAYYDSILQCSDLVNTKKIAEDYGFTAQEFNKLLSDFGIQYKKGKTWYLYKKYLKGGYTQTRTYCHASTNGTHCATVWNYWTQRGRLFLYEFLKEKGIMPKEEKLRMEVSHENHL